MFDTEQQAIERMVKHGEPIETRRMVITPEIAKIMLKFNTRNRVLSQMYMRNLAVQMAGGHWSYTGDTIKFSNSGKLIDGQHRLQACIQAETEFVTDVKFGLNDDVFDRVDVGMRRTTGQLLEMKGCKNWAMVAGMIRLVAGFDSGKLGKDVFQHRLTAHEALNLYSGPYGDIHNSVWVGQLYSTYKLSTPSLAGALHYLCHRKDGELADHFFRNAVEGIGLEQTDPIYQLHRRLVADAASRQEKLPNYIKAGLFIKAWNAKRAGRTTRHLKLAGNEAAPEII